MLKLNLSCFFAVYFFTEMYALYFVYIFLPVDPPKKRVDALQINGQPRLSLGDLSEGSPIAPRRALTIQQLYVFLSEYAEG